MKNIKTESEKQNSLTVQHSLAFAGWGLFFAGVFLYSLYIIQPNLTYHAFGRFTDWPIFYTGWVFFAESASKAGGLSEYGAAFLSQWYYYSPVGAAIITVFAVLLTILTDRLIINLGLKLLRILSCIPAVMLLSIQSRYEHQLDSYLSLIITLILLLTYTKISFSNNLFRAMLVILTSAFLSYLSGFGAAFIFILSAGLFESLTRKNHLFGAFCILAAAAAYASVHNRLFDIDIFLIQLRAFSNPNKLSWPLTYCPTASYLLIPLLFLLAWMVPKLKHILPQQTNKSTVTRHLYISLKNVLVPTLYLIIVLSVAMTAQNKQKKYILKISTYSEKGMWQQLLDYAASDNIHQCLLTNHDTNLALYHCGRLGSDMFSFRQSIPALLLTFEPGNLLAFVSTKRANFLMQLGLLGVANKTAFESFEITQAPYALEQLAYINLAKGQIETAKVFLNALCKDLIYAQEAKKLLQQIKTDPELKSNSRIQHIRAVMPDSDTPAVKFDVDLFFSYLLQKNPQNKMAFEYMMAYYLLSGQLDKVVNNLWRLKDLGYQKTPPLYEEAFALYLRGSGGQKPSSVSFEPDIKTVEQAKIFEETFKRSGGAYAPEAAAQALSPKFGNTYLYYYFLTLPGQRK